MENVVFFTDPDILLKQTDDQVFGPVSSDKTNKFRVLNKFKAEINSKIKMTGFNRPRAYAVYHGQIRYQLNEQSSSGEIINCILKPSNVTFEGVPIKYFIYRGIVKSSITDQLTTGGVEMIRDAAANPVSVAPARHPKYIDSEFSLLKKQVSVDSEYSEINNLPFEYLGTKLKEPSSGYPLEYSVSNSDDIEFLFNDIKYDDGGVDKFVPVSVNSGTLLGEFDPDEFSFQIVLDSNVSHTNVNICRNHSVNEDQFTDEIDHIVDVTAFPESTVFEKQGKNLARESVTKYLDCLVFFSHHLAKENLRYCFYTSPFKGGATNILIDTYVVEP
ncbi:MAG TPA: hypothetical protein VGF79_07515, partial [Bacteroidia bacterium]